MIADLLSPNRWNWLIANVKNFNLNVTEVLVSDFKNAFSQNFQFHRRDPNEEIIAFFAALREESNTVRSRLVEADANSIVGTQRVTNFYGPDDLTSGSSSSDESYNFEIESSSSDSSGILEPLSRTENDRLAELERLDIARTIRIPTVKLNIPEKAFFKSETLTSVTFKLLFLTLAIYQWHRFGLSHGTNVKNIKRVFHIFFMVAYLLISNRCHW